MSAINIYKIENTLFKDFYQKLEIEKYKKLGNDISIPYKTINFKLEFFMCEDSDATSPDWKWVLVNFDQKKLETFKSPKAVLVITKSNNKYVCTFGAAHFNVDKFCDNSFPFTLGRKLQFKEIKTTTLVSPTSKKNKSVNTYIDYTSLEFDSGEAFIKIKAKLNINAKFNIIKDTIELGHSVKIILKENQLKHICRLLYIAECIVETKKDKNKIPIFVKIKDKNLIESLEKSFIDNVKQKFKIHLSELDIIGVTEFFNSKDYDFVIKCESEKKPVTQIDYDTINDFAINKLNSSLEKKFFDIIIITKCDGKSVRRDKLLDLIDYTDDAEKCILIKGKWYRFNDDYVNYLNESMAEIETVYNMQYNFSSTEHDTYIDAEYAKCKNDDAYKDLTEDTAKIKLKRTLYKERVFNIIRARDNGFENYDRQEMRIKNHQVELMDLYKDELMCAVKFGNASSVLCYAVDQSLTSLKLVKSKEIKIEKPIKKVALWFVLEKVAKLPLVDSRPDLRQLEMLSLKNKIDTWKKEVRQAGLEPVIYINYYQK